MNINKLHIITGVIALIIFLGTGIYMRINFPEIYAGNEIIRYQFRANHIYILMSGLINLLAGLNKNQFYSGWKKIIANLSFVTIFTATILLVAAFFIEPLKAIPERPLTAIGIFFNLFGVIFIFLPLLKK